MFSKNIGTHTKKNFNDNAETQSGCKDASRKTSPGSGSGSDDLKKIIKIRKN
jgi:hypothetical protein